MPQPATVQLKSRNGVKKSGLLANMRSTRRWWPFLVGGLVALCRLRAAWTAPLRSVSAAPVQLEETPEDTSQDLTVEPQELVAYAIFVTVFVAFRVCGSRMARFTLASAAGKAQLNMSRLNQAVLFKEVMLAYMNAAVLEPVISLAGEGDLSTKGIILHICMLFSIFWWIFILSDAFDATDVTQSFQYKSFHEVIDKKPGDYDWLQMQALDDSGDTKNEKLRGSVLYDLGLWFILFCIFAAVVSPGITHRDVFHAYAMTFLWICMHHRCRQATSWNPNYLLTLFMPSTGLMPIEFCLPLQEVDSVEVLEEWRHFIQDRCGITLSIVA